MKKIVAMVLAGGAFSALGIIAGRRAKAAIPFGGIYRIIDFVLSNLTNSNIEHVGILAQYRPGSLIDHIGSGASWDLFGRTRAVKILPPYKGEDDSDWYKGTADAVYQNLNFIRDRNPSEVMVLAGENIYTMNYQELIRFHREKKADCTLVCNPLPTADPHRFGVMTLEDDGRVKSYHEKPKTILGDYYSAGIYIFRTEYLIERLTADAMNPESRHNIADNITLDMLQRGDRFYGYVFNDYWAYCGTLEEYWKANMDLLDESSKLDLWTWMVRTNLDDRNIGGHQPAVMRPGSHVVQSLISSGCRISGTVENSILSPGVIVEPGAMIRDSIVMHETVIQKDAVLDRVIADKDVVIGEGSRIGIGDMSIVNTTFPKFVKTGLTLLGKDAHVGRNVSLGRNVLIYPGSSVPDNAEIESGDTIT
ncbi:glucose-1-phosphate adenylyltransferase [candidate division KSB3 bacterium]|uniref:Glucose-1-phosphate adenylyltransferase n=1 Tax=candidate division KSB3 bacterium TaxID=2044937 RepID=A0A2G6E120_9BACT|nr:MAG: glucose-1-phosphate adenylyltransferase [candidate division KSB3 bacterium]PIE30321.1 MAG: glucose-1-phosphate adenylyltransferase [candidate division KSB3 bacterium]